MAHYIPTDMGVVFFTGPRGAGARTMADTFHKTLCYDRKIGQQVELVNSGELIKTFGRGLSGKIGRTVTEHLRAGEPIGDTTMTEIFYMWLINECDRNRKLKTVILSGAPRNRNQTRLIGVVENPLIVNLGCNREELLSIAEENGSGHRFHQHWDAYENDLLPAIKRLKPRQVVHVDRTNPLQRRIEHVLQAMKTRYKTPVPVPIIEEALRAITDNRSPISRQIAEIDPPKKQELVTAT